jgi:hypothetical protein
LPLHLKYWPNIYSKSSICMQEPDSGTANCEDDDVFLVDKNLLKRCTWYTTRNSLDSGLHKTTTKPPLQQSIPPKM